MTALARIGGPLAVAGYAVTMVLLVAVWDPSAAVPWLSYGEILAGLRDMGIDPVAAFVGVALWGLLGVALSVAVSLLDMRGRVDAAAGAALQLGLVAAGAPAYFAGRFSFGVDIADTFAVGGGDHTPVGGVLYLVSAAALAALVALALLRRRWDDRGSSRVFEREAP
ncbi:MYXO-CTERM domain-containing protein [Conyzicola lurida]|uniref:MYXO-CTERM domain-containing protein n=1 Tax=Conyzicola lurida TaxID=1172621 RepID=A0A841ASB2_9MICO|nr:hypothetical protein [Conyzicola lurida]MBB5844309.1 MYXO-CTERM domain-containing protein [Conyzicola lurida]